MRYAVRRIAANTFADMIRPYHCAATIPGRWVATIPAMGRDDPRAMGHDDPRAMGRDDPCRPWVATMPGRIAANKFADMIRPYSLVL